MSSYTRILQLFRDNSAGQDQLNGWRTVWRQCLCVYKYLLIPQIDRIIYSIALDSLYMNIKSFLLACVCFPYLIVVKDAAFPAPETVPDLVQPHRMNQDSLASYTPALRLCEKHLQSR